MSSDEFLDWLSELAPLVDYLEEGLDGFRALDPVPVDPDSLGFLPETQVNG